MPLLFEEWIKLFKIFFSKKSIKFINKLLRIYLKSLKNLFIYFGWLFLVDMLFFSIYSDYFFKAMDYLNNPITYINPNYMMIILFISIIWFILPTALLLCIRREGDVNFYYFQNSFFHYVQLKLVFSLIFFLVFNLLIHLGITIFPKIHWTLAMTFKLIELITILFWLDSSYRFSDIFYALERAINLLLYQLPFFYLVLFLMLIFHLSLCSFLDGFKIDYNFYRTINALEITNFFGYAINNISIISKIKFFLWRYFLFLLNFLYVAFIYTFYSIKKREQFARSLLEPKSNSDPYDSFN